MRVKVAMMMLDWFIGKMHCNQIQRTVPDTCLGRNGVSKLSDLAGFSAKKNRFKRIFVVQMNMHRRYNQIVRMVLEL